MIYIGPKKTILEGQAREVKKLICNCRPQSAGVSINPDHGLPGAVRLHVACEQPFGATHGQRAHVERCVLPGGAGQCLARSGVVQQPAQRVRHGSLLD